jgi:hypothetical protein
MHRQIARDTPCTIGRMTPSRRLRTMLLAAAIALAAAAALAAGNATDASVAALKASLGNPRALEVDEVRITGDGVACIEYRVVDAAGKQDRGHAVVRGNDVLRSPGATNADPKPFEKAWSEHCLGPKGGMTSEP